MQREGAYLDISNALLLLAVLAGTTLIALITAIRNYSHRASHHSDLTEVLMYCLEAGTSIIHMLRHHLQVYFRCNSSDGPP